MAGDNFLKFTKEIYQARKEPSLKIFQDRYNSLRSLVIQPETIHKEFRLLVADLHYFLSIHQRILDLEEKNLELVPYELRSKLKREILNQYGKQISEGIHHYSTSMEPLCENLTAEEHFRYKAYFQEHLLNLFTFSC